MKKISLSLFLLLMYVAALYAQKQGNIWYFPQYAGLNLSTGTATALTDGQAFDSEGCSSICDSAGNLLMYATPTTIWNRNHAIMPNGSGIMGGYSSTQGAMLIPKPGSNTLFYLFTLGHFQDSLAKGFRYTLIDMCLDEHNGDVVEGEKNILILNGTSEKLTATYQSNGTDLWIVVRKHFTNEFYSYPLTAAGLGTPVISAIGWYETGTNYSSAIGQMKISPDGTKIAFGLCNQVPNIVQLFDFNKTTGVVSNRINLPTSTNSGCPYGIAFSPDNSKLYAWAVTPGGLDQFDLSSGDSATIVNSEHHVTYTGPYGGTGLQLANNGKIYVCQPGNHIGIIHSPNLAGDACNFVGQAMVIPSFYSLPSFIDSYQYTNGIPDCDVSVEEHNAAKNLMISPNPFSGSTEIKSNTALKNASISITNSCGQKVKQLNGISGTSFSLHCEDLPKGIYFMELSQQGKVLQNEKIIITEHK